MRREGQGVVTSTAFGYLDPLDEPHIRGHVLALRSHADRIGPVRWGADLVPARELDASDRHIRYATGWARRHVLGRLFGDTRFPSDRAQSRRYGRV